MMWQNYHLGNTISKAAEDTRLWQTEKGIVEIGRNTLAVQVVSHDHVKGYVFQGRGKLLLDTIVETEEGAVGKPVEKQIDKPFIMLGNAERTEKRLNPASPENISEAGYKTPREFIDAAEELLNRFFKNGMHYHRCSGDGEGLIFAFKNENDNLDLLLTKNEKLVYKAMGTVFVSNSARTILKSREFVCISDGRSVLFKR